MIALDTNVLVRYIVQDHVYQSKIATEILEKRCTKTNPVFVSFVVLCELVWVLAYTYQYEKHVILSVLKQLFSTSELFIEDITIARNALELFSHGKADFSDYLIVKIAQKHGITETFTFDRKAGECQGFNLIL